MAGPGTELKRIFSWFGIKEHEGCKCTEHATLMDKWGPDGCQVNRPTIIQWLQQECKERNLPFNKTIANIALTTAINRSRKSK